ncbi:alpha/beta fold hydrolase [Alkalihalobacterium chitinilyticum]|uniref:Alpha/beta hydrolase n=1 Tax=Alkalihalobacterium chitinilyticum TaxID=2980103 RepID=A0ABT5VE74_9BACI|nr:alpha/beta hydrolase [Alkalihalobacterium chitinilyticum]MDE5413627.1 alpha/beta hydrolase [Alkalihalobacterium chitinilyticum]
MLHYHRQGTGEPLLLIHGFLSTNRVYDKVRSDLIDTYDVISIDLPGHGKSPLKKENTVYDYAHSIIQLLDSLKITNATWVGHSMGGYITMAAIEKYTPYVKRAAFVYSSPVHDSEKDKAQRDEHIDLVKREGVAALAKKRIPSYFAFQGDPKDVSEAYRHADQTTPEGTIAALHAMKERPNQVDMLNRIDFPLFFLEGTKDLSEAPFHATSSQITKASTDTSHMGMLDNPQQFITELKNWLTLTD